MDIELIAEQGAVTIIALSLLLFCYKITKMHINTHCKTRNIEIVISDDN